MIDRARLPDVLQSPLGTNVGMLLESRLPARLAWVAQDGSPRVVPIWFLWTGKEVLMATSSGARKLADLNDGDSVALSIDTADFPYRSLKIRGPVALRPSSGLADAYRDAALRYLGATMAERWIAFLGDPDQVVLAVRPTWAVASDMAADSPFFEQAFFEQSVLGN